MKFFSIAACAIVAVCILPETMAQNTQPKVPTPTAMAQATAHIRFLTEARPAPDAEFYMYVNSAYWCGPCRQVMPKIIAEYAEMRKENKLEVILLSHDRSEAAARHYIQQYAMPFSAVMYRSKERTKLPGAPDNVMGIPYIVVVDAQGNTVHTGHAATFKNWRQFTKKPE